MSEPAVPPAPQPAKGLRDRPLGRVLIIAVILGGALLITRSCTSMAPDVTKDEAIAIARTVAVIEPERIQVRFVRRGVPTSHGFWAVSLYRGPETKPTVVQLVLIDGESGEIVDDGLG